MDKTNRVAIIIPYFGTFPNYFNYWLKSALANRDFTFFIFTDNTSYKTINNVKFIKMQFEEFKDLLQKQINFPIYLNEPYKLCDYRPVYGCALQDYIKEYEFWGFGDIDLIYGKLDHFITENILNNYDKIYNLGHLTILKNCDKCNFLWREKHDLKNAYRYDEAFRTPYTCHFDEAGGLTQISKLKKIKTYNSIDFGDIEYTKYNFVLYGRQNHVYKGLFKWKKGILTYIYLKENQIISEEICYAHFQKRQLSIDFNRVKNKNEYIIIPNKITYSENINKLLNEQKIQKYYPYYEKNKLKMTLSKIKRHAIQQRIYRLCVKKIYRSILDKRY